MQELAIVKQLESAVGDGMVGVKQAVDLPELFSRVLAIDVCDDLTYGGAGEIAKEIRSALRGADEERKKITGPLNESLKTVNAMYKRLVEPLESADTTIRGKMARYAEDKRKREQEESRKAQEILLRAAEKAEKEKLPEVAEKALDIAVRMDSKPTEAVRTTKATTTSRKIFAGFTVEDVAAVPEGYKVVDERKVRDAYAAGVRSIPGLSIIERESIVIR